MLPVAPAMIFFKIKFAFFYRSSSISFSNLCQSFCMIKTPKFDLGMQAPANPCNLLICMWLDGLLVSASLLLLQRSTEGNDQKWGRDSNSGRWSLWLRTTTSIIQATPSSWHARNSKHHSLHSLHRPWQISCSPFRTELSLGLTHLLTIHTRLQSTAHNVCRPQQETTV